MPQEQRTYMCIDMKSFYASVECAERCLNPFETCLVVADETRGPNALCLAISPKMKALGVNIACTKQLKKRELIQTVRELRELVIAERKARNRMNLYSAVCPICGKINQNLLLEETEGTMECESCGSVVNVLGMEDGNAIPILTKELCASIMARAAV